MEVKGLQWRPILSRQEPNIFSVFSVVDSDNTLLPEK
jgi:hypothetical protein